MRGQYYDKQLSYVHGKFVIDNGMALIYTSGYSKFLYVGFSDR